MRTTTCWGIADSAGVLRERYEYSAYGQRQVFVSSGTNDPGCYTPTTMSTRVLETDYDSLMPWGICEFGHQGLMHDEESNLVYNRARMLQPTLGRFMQLDKAMHIDGLNLYNIYKNRPLDLNDPTGNASIQLQLTTATADLGNSGAYTWRTTWKLSTANSKDGMIVQKIDLKNGMQDKDGKKITGENYPTESGFPDTQTYWEAWPVAANSTAPNPSDDQWHDNEHFWTQGTLEVTGTAQYYECLTSDMLRKLGWSVDTVARAGTALATRKDPNGFQGVVGPKGEHPSAVGSPLSRSISVSWDSTVYNYPTKMKPWPLPASLP